MKKIIVVVGPTGVGKTKLSIMLAKKYNGEIINADSMQIYKGLNIGTAKVTEEEKGNVNHHLLDIKEVDEDYSIYNYQLDCRRVINNILKKGKVVIIVGGTGLYVKSALYDYKLSEFVNKDNYEDYSTDELYNVLISMDKDSIGKIDKNNRRRIINAINYFNNNKSSITSNKTNKLLYDACFIGLTVDRKVLYDKINKRVDEMVKNGLIDEVKHFYDLGIDSKPLLSGIGYKELYDYFDKKISLEKAIELIKKNSRNYAKRQYTFFNNSLQVKWFDTNYDDFNKTYEKVIMYINGLK